MAKLQTKWLSDLSVTTAKLADLAVTNAKVAAGAAIAESKLALDYSTSSLNTAISNHVADTANPHSVTKTQVGLGNVDNTSDANKPVSTAQQAALDLKADLSLIGANNGIASLDAGGKVPVSQLPNSVMTYEGVWNATTNSPALSDGTGNAGMVYRVSVAGSQDFGSGSISFQVGDYVIYSSTGVWEKSDTTDAVASVNGQTGIVVLDADDISDAATTNKFATAAEKTKLGFISVTQAVDLDTMESDIASNASAISNHLADAADAHDASAISYVNTTSGLTATDAQAAIDEVEGRLDTAESSLSSHVANTSNPHSVTKAQVGLGSVDNVQQLPMSYLDIDDTLAADSDVKVPSQQAVKAFVASSIAAIPAAASPRQEIITLIAGDITNGYVDLALEASDNDSVIVTPKGAPMQESGVDFTLSVVSNKTRITFAGDLLLLEAGDKLMVQYLS